MWTRAQLKTNAKTVLKKSYWYSFLVTLVYGAISSGGSSISYKVSSPEELTGLLGYAIAGGIAAFFLSLLVVSPFEIGVNRFFLECTQFRVDIGEIIFPFKNGKEKYLNIVAVQFFRGLFTFLWTLLFIIPGIVKSYAYMMVPYILSENPSMPYRRALQLSEDMMRGHKFDTFVLGLSFIGWYLLGALCLGIGVLFVNPYAAATNAQLYLALRTIALDKGIVQLEELEPPFEAQM